MPNVMAARPNIDGALCESSVNPFLVPRRKLWLTPAAGLPCSNAANTAERKTWTYSEYCTGQNSDRGKSPRKCIYSVPAHEMAKHRANFGWPPVSDVAAVTKARCEKNQLKFAGVPQTPEPISAVSGPKFAIYCRDMEEILPFNKFFRLSMHAFVAKIQPDKILCNGSQMANFWRFFASCIFSEPRAADFKPAF